MSDSSLHAHFSWHFVPWVSSATHSVSHARLCSLLYSTVKLTRAIGDSTACIALWVGRRPVSMCACLHCWSSQPRDFIAVYAATLPMRRTSMTVRVRCVSGLPTSAATSRSACQYTRSLPANIQEAASPGVSVRSCRGSGSTRSPCDDGTRHPIRFHEPRLSHTRVHTRLQPSQLPRLMSVTELTLCHTEITLCHER